PPLREDTEVTGPVVVRLYAASTARDTDFIARLIDVYPDGTAYNLTEGLVRARFRASIWEEPSLIEPGQVYEYVIEMQPTSNVFLRGHRIRLHITSSNFPLIDRNTNVGGDIGFEDHVVVAEQTVWHGGACASRIVLPVIP
ncbi:CocE/NonD family hydrolase, partial [Candidatus Poribacteria bacterium]|nr:CocE/NonD family hydrolase [Candidatus Poribacteria bacterium]